MEIEDKDRGRNPLYSSEEFETCPICGGKVEDGICIQCNTCLSCH